MEAKDVGGASVAVDNDLLVTGKLCVNHSPNGRHFVSSSLKRLVIKAIDNAHVLFGLILYRGDRVLADGGLLEDCVD